MLWFRILLLVWLVNTSIYAQELHEPLLSYSTFLADSSGLLTIESFQSGIGLAFGKENELSNTFPTWVRIVIPEQLPSGDYCIDLRAGAYAELYFKQNDRWTMTRNGAEVLPSQRSVPEQVRYLCFHLSAEERTIFLMIPPNQENGKLKDLYMEARERTLNKVQHNTRLSFVLTGCLLVIIVGSFVLWIMLRDTNFLLFGVYLTSFYVMINKVFLSYLLGEYLPLLLLNKYMNQVYFILSPVAFLLFSNSFLMVKDASQRWNTVFKIALAFSVVCFATLPVSISLNSDLVLFYNVLCVLVVTLFSWVSYSKHKYKPALYFLIGVSIPFIAAIAIALNYVGVLSIDRLQMVADGAVLAFSFVLSMGVVARFRQVNFDLVQVSVIKLQKEYESEAFKIRNVELQALNSKIEDQSYQIQEHARKLEELNITKNKLLSVLSHDLRGPVENLRIVLKLLGNKQMTQDEFLELSRNLNTEVDGVHRMLEDVLRWVKSQQEGITVHKINFNIETLTHEVVKLSAQYTLSKEVQIKIVAEGLLEVFADFDHVHIIIRNLLSNALKFSPKRSHIVVCIAPDDNENQIRVSIKDQGPGMYAQNIKKVLRGDKIASTRGTDGEKGTGLGLLLCQEFIQHNGGRFFITSEIGVGSEFSFTLDRTENLSKPTPHRKVS